MFKEKQNEKTTTIETNKVKQKEDNTIFNFFIKLSFSNKEQDRPKLHK